MLLLIITYLAGVLTILSPCILPVLPFVFARSQQSFVKSGLPLLAGMSLTFSLFSALAIVGGEWISHANELGRWVALALLTIFGLSLVFPQLSEKIMAPLTRLGSSFGQGVPRESPKASFLIGIGTGLLWAPCAGPILGLVLTGAAAQGSLGVSLGLLLAYSLGAATSLSLALVAGNKFLGTLKGFLGWDQIIKKVLGVAVLLGVVAIVFKLDRSVLTRLSKLETVSVENKLLKATGLAPKADPIDSVDGQKNTYSLAGAVAWLNSPPLEPKDLLGKVVLVDFWTYSCINCLRTLPYLKAWYEKYKDAGLVIVGVHTPEFGFEKSVANVESALKDVGIAYPVAVDSEYKIWNAFSNRYWPAHYFIDRMGAIRSHHFGEGDYEESEKTLRELLSENGKVLKASDTKVLAQGVEAPSAEVESQSPETYLGYGRVQNFSSKAPLADEQSFRYPAHPKLHKNEWSLEGQWWVAKDRAKAAAPKAKIFFKFYARDLHLVLGAAKKIKFKVTLDGYAPGANHGQDIDAQGQGEIENHRLYQLIRQKGDISEHLFEIEFLDEGAEAYAFTFG